MPGRAGRGSSQRATTIAARCAPWLYKIATNRCLTFLARARRRELPTAMTPDVAAAKEVLWLEPFPDSRMAYADRLDPAERVVAWESVELAFVAALQDLTTQAARRAAAARGARLLGRRGRGAPGDVRGGSQQRPAAGARTARPRRLIGAERGLAATVDESGETDEIVEVARRYAAAWEAGDVEAIVAMLAEDARYSMPPLPAVVRRARRDPRLPGRRTARLALALPAGSGQRQARRSRPTCGPTRRACLAADGSRRADDPRTAPSPRWSRSSRPTSPTSASRPDSEKGNLPQTDEFALRPGL